MTGAVEFTDIKFAYGARADVTIFDGFNLSIKPGKNTALVGESGSGAHAAFGWRALSGRACVIVDIGRECAAVASPTLGFVYV